MYSVSRRMAKKALKPLKYAHPSREAVFEATVRF